MQKPVHPSFGRVKPVVDGLKYGWTGGGREKMKGQKRWSNTIDIVIYASKVSVNGVTRVFVSISGHQTHFKVYKLA